MQGVNLLRTSASGIQHKENEATSISSRALQTGRVESEN